MVSGVFFAPAPIAQLAEAADLKSAQCRFESDWGHREWIRILLRQSARTVLPLAVHAPSSRSFE